MLSGCSTVKTEYVYVVPPEHLYSQGVEIPDLPENALNSDLANNNAELRKALRDQNADRRSIKTFVQKVTEGGK